MARETRNKQTRTESKPYNKQVKTETYTIDRKQFFAAQNPSDNVMKHIFSPSTPSRDLDPPAVSFSLLISFTQITRPYAGARSPLISRLMGGAMIPLIAIGGPEDGVAPSPDVVLEGLKIGESSCFRYCTGTLVVVSGEAFNWALLIARAIFHRPAFQRRSVA